MFELLKILKREYYYQIDDNSMEARNFMSTHEKLEIEENLTNIFFLGIAIVLPIAIYINVLTGLKDSVFNFIIFSLLTISLLLTIENLIKLYMDIKNNNEMINIDFLVIKLFKKNILAFTLLILAPFASATCSIIDFLLYILMTIIAYLSLKLAPQKIINIDIIQVIGLIISAPITLYIIEVIFKFNINFNIYAYVTTYFFYFFTILIYTHILLLTKRIPPALATASNNLTINDDSINISDIYYGQGQNSF